MELCVETVSTDNGVAASTQSPPNSSFTPGGDNYCSLPLYLRACSVAFRETPLTLPLKYAGGWKTFRRRKRRVKWGVLIKSESVHWEVEPSFSLERTQRKDPLPSTTTSSSSAHTLTPPQTEAPKPRCSDRCILAPTPPTRHSIFSLPATPYAAEQGATVA